VFLLQLKEILEIPVNQARIVAATVGFSKLNSHFEKSLELQVIAGTV